VAELHTPPPPQNLLAARAGEILSYSEVARELGIPVNTVKRYVRFLEIWYRVVLLRPLQSTLAARLATRSCVGPPPRRAGRRQGQPRAHRTDAFPLAEALEARAVRACSEAPGAWGATDWRLLGPAGWGERKTFDGQSSQS